MGPASSCKKAVPEWLARARPEVVVIVGGPIIQVWVGWGDRVYCGPAGLGGWGGSRWRLCMGWQLKAEGGVWQVAVPC